MAESQPIIVRNLGRRDYPAVWSAMERFTENRGEDTADEIWLVEHPPVFTQGRNGKPEHLLAPDDIPVIQVDRGGQVTYHGPGQLVVYVLLDLARRGLGVRQLVRALEQAVIDTLAEWRIVSAGREDAPGVYVDGAKIASVGLRVRRGRTYHGLSLNVNMDLGPFQRINPCGYQGLQVTQLSDLGGATDLEQVSERLVSHLTHLLRYTIIKRIDDNAGSGELRT